MSTATPTSPLESYQRGRDSFLAAVLDVASGLETSVIEFQNQHEGQARTAAAELAAVRRDKARLEQELGEQALELEASRNHVCSAPAGGSEEPAKATAVAAPDTARDEIIAELREALEADERVIAGLRADLEAEQNVSSGLRRTLEKNTGRVAHVEELEGKLQTANETHARYVTESREAFDRRLADGVRTAETKVRGEAVRIIDAIAADNPALAEAAELFTVAFPGEAAADGATDSGVADAPHAEPLVQEIAEADIQPQPATEENFFNALPAPDPESVPEPMTQVLLSAPDLGDDAILDPHFFDNPVPLEEPDVQTAEVPKPGHGLFGRKKEDQTV